MNLNYYKILKQEIINRGYQSDIDWSENIKPPKSKWQFYWIYIYVILNSGMKQQIALKIFNKVLEARDINLIGHPDKRKYALQVADELDYWWQGFQYTQDKFQFISTMPYMGKVIRYHMAKNCGLDVVKPDRHLVRIANLYNTTPEELCNKLSKESGDKKVTVDTILWRAANLGLT